MRVLFFRTIRAELNKQQSTLSEADFSRKTECRDTPM
jgi:hypothetical protein